MGQLILYGRGLIAEEYARYLEGQGRGADIAAFAVTRLNGQGKEYCGRPCMEIEEAIKIYPEADIHLTLQEKYHEEVIGLLAEFGREPKEIIGLHRMTQLLGEQGIREISAACPELTVGRNPYDYSMLEIFPHQHPEKKFTFYPMTQVPLSQTDIRNLQQTVSKFSNGSVTSRPYLPRLRGRGTAQAVEGVGCQLYLAMATSLKDARVSLENLPAYIHPVMGGAAGYDGPRTAEMAYDDEEADNLSLYNSLYSELTVAHWLWKNAPKANYLGLCHYRRHFVLTEEVCQAMAENTVDVLLTRPRFTVPNVREFFTNLPVTYTDNLDYETMMCFIGKRDEKLAAFAEDFFSGQVQFPNNMVIARRKIYLRYCEFMFGILLDMQAYYREQKIERQNRYLGNVGEMLTAVYFAYRRDKWCTEFVDYQLLE